MDTGDRFEREAAGREARDSVPLRSTSSRRAAIMDALKRYLSSETYRSQHTPPADSRTDDEGRPS